MSLEFLFSLIFYLTFTGKTFLAPAQPDFLNYYLLKMYRNAIPTNCLYFVYVSLVIQLFIHFFFKSCFTDSGRN